jgi:hypothetical protein
MNENDAMTEIDPDEETLLSREVSDEALEAAAMVQPPGHALTGPFTYLTPGMCC